MDDAGIEAKGEGSSGRILAAVSYFLSWIIALVIYFVAKERFVRYHALQAILLDFAIVPVLIVEYLVFIVSIITIIGPCLVWLVVVLTLFAVFLLKLYLAISAFKGRAPMVPVIGKIAKDHVE